jgi:hypothetical protein
MEQRSHFDAEGSVDRPYVVLHHTGWGPAHYDLLLDPADSAMLLTWRLKFWPPAEWVDADNLASHQTEEHEGSHHSVGERLPDHRRLYLTYEGPVSGGRGLVKRVAAGTVRLRTNPDQNQLLVVFDHEKYLILPLHRSANTL